jgi:hypothetical protein
MNRVVRRVALGSVFVGIMAAPRVALACPVCFGMAAGPMADAMNAGIFFMLAIITVVLGGFASFIVHLVRQAKRAGEQEAAGAAVYRVPGGSPTEGTA